MILQEDVEFLEHFGVKGMQWGVVKEERSANKQAKFEERVGKRQAKSDEIGTQLKKKNLRLNKKYKLMDEKVRIDQEISDLSDGKRTERQKKIIKGAAITVGALAAYGTYRAVQSGDMNRLILKGSAFVQGKDLFNKKEMLSADMSPDLISSIVVKPINRGYGDMGTKVNCRRCTFAYELRRRGYDVAATKTTNSYGQHGGGMMNAIDGAGPKMPLSTKKLLSTMSKEAVDRINADLDPVLSNTLTTYNSGTSWVPKPDKLFSAIGQNPSGARGEVSVTWAAGGGHSMAWEVIGGKPYIFDTQSGKMFGSMRDVAKEFGEDSIGQAGFTRLDNLKLDEDFLARWVKNA